MRFIDIHTHRDTNIASLCLRNLDVSELANDGLPLADVTTDMTDDGPWFSVGLHPWFIDRQDIEFALTRLDDLCRNRRVLAVGECGLDKCIATPLERQLTIFKRQIALSERLDKPLLIHCVRAFNELQQLKNALSPKQAWIVHGFTGHKTLAEQLVKQGFHLSFGKALLQPESKASAAFLTTPPDRRFLETDDAAGLQIGEIYQAAAKMAGLNLSALQELIQANFERVFRHD